MPRFCTNISLIPDFLIIRKSLNNKTVNDGFIETIDVKESRNLFTDILLILV